jgi:hypothetical protein
MPNGNMMSPMGMPGGLPPGIPMGGGGGPSNALTKPSPPAGQTPGGFSAEQHVEQNWQQAQTQHKQLMASEKRMKVARTMLDSLKKKGDQVQVEDVIEGAGTMVGAGFSPQALAQMLAQMPTTGGEALQAWVEQQDQRAQQMDMQLQQTLKSSAIHRAITGMASLHIHSIKQKHMAMAGPSGPAMGGGNALGPQMGTPSPSQGGEEAPDETGD